MTTASLVVIAMLVAVLAGIAFTVWLWRTYCPRRVAAGGLRALAAMRWREFSRFVIEALQAQGFEASRLEPSPERGQKADVLLTRDGETWLLACKQGVDYRVTRTMVDDLARSVRVSGARGGILSTLGGIEPEVRRHAGSIELVDGATLWPLIEPLLPPSLHDDLLGRARRDTTRTTILAWIAVLVFGVAGGLLLSQFVAEPAPAATPAEVPAAPAPSPADEAPEAAALPSAPLTEQEQRDRIQAGVVTLPGIADAAWISNSTLLVYLMPDSTEAQVETVCEVVGRSELLGASRIQLQPPPGSTEPVRFTRCRVY